MKIYALDRNFYELKQYELALSKFPGVHSCFSYLSQLTEAIDATAPDIILVDNELPTLKKLIDDTRKLHPSVKFILVGSRLTAEQLNMGLDGWIEKPITKAKIEKQIFNIKHPLWARMKHMAESEKTV